MGRRKRSSFYPQLGALMNHGQVRCRTKRSKSYLRQASKFLQVFRKVLTSPAHPQDLKVSRIGLSSLLHLGQVHVASRICSIQMILRLCLMPSND
ncbi:hypothetical protein EMPG_17827 [Blastomyces silverae]|uniref:Uncharacterized protein n=1 Tax=Blastomyces silverae TaxID=2060906 RepID=A0A0H1BBQ3_9EURO|nr:hypothetical protein EMPG_17827 [Blastomyces silverae]